MEEDANYRTLHGLPVRTFAPGPLGSNFRPKSASAKQQPHAAGELSWHSHMDHEQSAAKAGYGDHFRHELGTSFLLDDTGHWIDPEV